MECPCGAETQNRVHEVKTMNAALEWTNIVSEADLPIKVIQDVCRACKRQQTRVLSCYGEMLITKG